MLREQLDSIAAGMLDEETARADAWLRLQAARARAASAQRDAEEALVVYEELAARSKVRLQNLLTACKGASFKQR